MESLQFSSSLIFHRRLNDLLRTRETNLQGMRDKKEKLKQIFTILVIYDNILERNRIIIYLVRQSFLYSIILNFAKK